jgi:hypothetical protein
MNKENKLLLQALAYADSQRRHPSLPDHARVIRKYNDNGANALTKCITDFLTFSGWQAERINTTGRYVVEKGAKDEVFNRNFDKGKFIKGTGTRGSADISATIKGRSVKIEVKYGKDRQSQAQKDYQVSIEAAGGVYVIARDFDTWKEWYDNFIKNIA